MCAYYNNYIFFMTILFLEDWNKYPTTIPDDTTTNESFLRMASLLKTMNVSNYYFFLALSQPELRGVDPYSENLTKEQKEMIAIECKYNPWYFFREVARVSSGNKPLQFRIIRPTLSLLWSFFCGIDYALVMPRQIGKSVVCDFLEIWLIYFYYDNTKMLLLTKDNELRKENIDRIKKAVKLLPDWLVPLTKKDADNQETITCVTKGNIYRTAVPQNSEEDAEKVGRGFTVPYFRLDEVPAIKNVQYSLPALSGATTTVRENYENDGVLHGGLYVTTAGELDTEEGAYTYSFFNSGTTWNERFYDCKNKLDARETVRINAAEEGRCLLYGVFSHRMCGKTDQWLKTVYGAVKRTIEQFERDFLNKWTSGSIHAAIAANILAIINASEIEPLYLEISNDRYIINWYIPRHEIESRLNSGDFIAGLDTGNQIGRDANALVIMDTRDMSVVATSRVAEGSLHRYALWLAELLIRFPKLTLIPENKMSAQGIMDTIAIKLIERKICPFKRIYNKIVDEYKSYPEEYQEISNYSWHDAENIYNKYKKLFGFITTGKSRTFIYDTVLNDAVQSMGHLIKDKMLSSELKGLILKNGKIDHLPNAHDDLVISLLLANWFVRHSKNLKHYGIDMRNCLSEVSIEGATLTPEEILNKKIVINLTQEVNELKQQLMSAYSITDSLRIEHILTCKVKTINELGNLTLSMDGILNEVNANKTNKRSLKQGFNKNNLNRLKLKGIYS